MYSLDLMAFLLITLCPPFVFLKLLFEECRSFGKVSFFYVVASISSQTLRNIYFSFLAFAERRQTSEARLRSRLSYRLFQRVWDTSQQAEFRICNTNTLLATLHHKKLHLDVLLISAILLVRYHHFRKSKFEQGLNRFFIKQYSLSRLQ